jgi:hypothetical protein
VASSVATPATAAFEVHRRGEQCPHVLGNATQALASPVRSVINIEWRRGALHDLLRNHHFLDPLEVGQVEHGVEQNGLHDRAQATRPGPPLDRLGGDGTERFLSKAEVDALHLEQPALLHRAFFGSTNIRLSAISSRSSRVAITGSRPTNSGINPYFSKSSGSTSRKLSPALRSSSASTLAPKPIEVERPRAEMIFYRPELRPGARRARRQPHVQRPHGLVGHGDRGAERAALAAILADSEDPWAHFALGCVYLFVRRFDDSLAEFELALRLNPNFSLAQGYYGVTLSYCGRWEEGDLAARRALRLSPRRATARTSIRSSGYGA